VTVEAAAALYTQQIYDDDPPKELKNLLAPSMSVNRAAMTKTTTNDH